MVSLGGPERRFLREPIARRGGLKEHTLERYTGMLGILAILSAAWIFSTDRKRIRWRTVAWGLGLQAVFAFLVLRFDYGQRAMAWAGGVSVICSHHTSSSSVSATLVKMQLASSAFMALRLLASDVPGATPKKPVSGLMA